MSVEIEVGIYSLMHTGMLGELGTKQRFDAGKMALLVYNDARDVRYIFTLADGATRTISPTSGDENCVMIMRRPGHAVSLESVCSNRLFCHETPEQTWPKKHFQCMNATENEMGDLDTAFVLLDDDYVWKNKKGKKALHTTFKTEGTYDVYHCLRGGVPEPFFSGVESVTIKLAGGSAQKCCPTGDPP
jgi:hypothetical protein